MKDDITPEEFLQKVKADIDGNPTVYLLSVTIMELSKKVALLEEWNSQLQNTVNIINETIKTLIMKLSGSPMKNEVPHFLRGIEIK